MTPFMNHDYAPGQTPKQNGVVKNASDSIRRRSAGVDTAALPEDHPVHYLAEARRLFQKKPLPFVRTGMLKSQEFTRSVVLATAFGKLPALIFQRAEIVG